MYWQFSIELSSPDVMFCGEGGMSAAIYLLLNYQAEGTVNGNEKIYPKHNCNSTKPSIIFWSLAINQTVHSTIFPSVYIEETNQSYSV